MKSVKGKKWTIPELIQRSSDGKGAMSKDQD